MTLKQFDFRLLIIKQKRSTAGTIKIVSSFCGRYSNNKGQNFLIGIFCGSIFRFPYNMFTQVHMRESVWILTYVQWTACKHVLKIEHTQTLSFDISRRSILHSDVAALGGFNAQVEHHFLDCDLLVGAEAPSPLCAHSSHKIWICPRKVLCWQGKTSLMFGVPSGRAVWGGLWRPCGFLVVYFVRRDYFLKDKSLRPVFSCGTAPIQESPPRSWLKKLRGNCQGKSLSTRR